MGEGKQSFRSLQRSNWEAIETKHSLSSLLSFYLRDMCLTGFLLSHKPLCMLQEPFSSSATHTPSPSLVQVGMIASYRPWIPLLHLLRPSPSTLHPLRSAHPIEAFVLGLMKAVFALCRGIYVRGRVSDKVCQSPSVRLGIITIAAHPLLILAASLEIIHL